MWAIKIGKRVISKHRKKPRVVKIVRRQTGTRVSLKRDQKRRALYPGKRLSRSGKTYYEYRRNRTDLRRKSGWI